MIKDVLGISPGITAVIGSGGKTTLIGKLAEEIRAHVIICTTTHIMRPDDMPVFAPEAPGLNGNSPAIANEMPEYEPALAAFLRDNTGHPVCVGLPDPENPAKLISYPIEEIERAAGENAFILVEADGSKHLPLKAHNENEPVIPKNCARVILVIGAHGFGKPIAEAVHRPEIFAKLTNTDVSSPVTPEAVAAVINAERAKFGSGRLQIFVNSKDTMRSENRFASGNVQISHSISGIRTSCDIPADTIKIARKIAALTGLESYAGSAETGVVISC